MSTRFFSMFVLAAALLLLPVFGGVGGFGEAQAESQYVNFEGDGEKDIQIPPNKTDVYPECYGLDLNAYAAATGDDFSYHCTSPVSDVTCYAGDPRDHCECNNGSKKDHTVKVHISSCEKPPAQ